MGVPFSKIIQNNKEYIVVDKVSQDMIAQAFNVNKAGGYKVNDVVVYGNKLYKFTGAHSGAWTGLDVVQVDAVGVLNEVNQNFTVVKEVTSDGVKTAGQLLIELFTGIDIPFDKTRVIESIFVYYPIIIPDNTYNELQYLNIKAADDNGIEFATIKVDSNSSASWILTDIAETGAVSKNDISDEVIPANQVTYKLVV